MHYLLNRQFPDGCKSDCITDTSGEIYSTSRDVGYLEGLVVVSFKTNQRYFEHSRDVQTSSIAEIHGSRVLAVQQIRGWVKKLKNDRDRYENLRTLISVFTLLNLPKWNNPNPASADDWISELEAWKPSATELSVDTVKTARYAACLVEGPFGLTPSTPYSMDPILQGLLGLEELDK